MYKLKSFAVLLAFLFTVCDTTFAALDGVSGKTVELTKDETAHTNVQTITGNTSIDGAGHSLDGNKFSQSTNGQYHAWMEATNNSAGTGLSVEIKNLGSFNLNETEQTGANTVLKINELNQAIRYTIDSTDGIFNFHTSGGSNGGSFLSSRDDLLLENLVIRGNSNTANNTNSKGGAISHSHNNSDDFGLTIKNSFITENYREALTLTSTAWGGAIYSEQKNGILDISDSYFTKNYINYNKNSTSSFGYGQGGAIGSNSGALKVVGSYFGDNYVIGTGALGGAIYAGADSADNRDQMAHTFDKTVFENNRVEAAKTQARGGALHSGNNTEIKDSLFLSNKAVLNLENQPTNNSAALGGAIYQSNNTKPTSLDITNSEFKNNSVQVNDSSVVLTTDATAAGGALYLVNGSANIKDTDFIGNSVQNDYTHTDIISSGGAIAIAPISTGYKGEFNIDNSTFSENQVVSMGTSRGGAIAVLATANTNNIRTVNITNSTINNNLAESKADSGAGAQGGAIYAGTLNFINLDNTTLDSNVSKSAAAGSENGGGAIYAIDRSIVTAVDSSFTNNSAQGEGSQGGAIYAAKGATINIIANEKDVLFEGNTADNISNAIHSSGGTINLNAQADKQIIFNDRITSDNKATLTINKKGTWDKTSWPYSNRIPNDAPNQGTVVLNEDMTGYKGAVSLEGGVLKIGQNGTFFDAKSFSVVNPSVLDAANGVIQTHNFGAFTLSAPLSLSLDANLENGTVDTFNFDSINVSNDAKININKINVIADAQAEVLSLNIKDVSNYDGILDIITLEEGAKTALGKVYKYDVELDEDKEEFSFTRKGMIKPGDQTGGSSAGPAYNEINPAVMVGPVAAQIGYVNQLNSFDQAFQNTISRMMQPKLRRNASLMDNRYAIVETKGKKRKLRYEEAQTNDWFRPYTSFEKVDFKGGEKVTNIMYGTYLGSDSRMFEMKNGKRGQFSGYLAYNGSHQTFDKNSMYQNGASLGVTGSLYKNNLFTALTLGGGISFVSASTMFGDDSFPMFSAGIASKTGYNIEFKEGKIVLQPNILVSYSLVNAFNYTNAADVKINSDPLNAIQISPGLRLFANTKSGWQPYLNFDFKWNIMDKTDFTAANISLPQLSIKPYVEYGLGVQKCFKDTIYGHLQTVLRNGGRNGIAFSMGLDVLLGKGSENL